jgi:serine/threonine protein phosphatase PrpC
VVPLADPAWPEQPDTVLDGFSLLHGEDEVLRVRAASLRGLAHRWYGRVRQDEYGWRVTGDGRYLVVCVADGVAAGPLSHLAAQCATRHGTAVLCGLLRDRAPDALPWAQVLEDVAGAIVETGARTLWPAKHADLATISRREVAEQLATTALYAILDLRPFDGAHDVTLLLVGDTSAWVLTEEGRWKPQQPVKNHDAELHSSSVFALPMTPATAPEPTRARVCAGEALVLMSDGVGDPLADGTGQVGRFLAEAWREPPADLEFAAQVGFVRRSYDDDRTVFAMWPVPVKGTDTLPEV